MPSILLKKIKLQQQKQKFELMIKRQLQQLENVYESSRVKPPHMFIFIGSSVSSGGGSIKQSSSGSFVGCCMHNGLTS